MLLRLLLLLALPTVAGAVTLGQFDDFEDPGDETMGWGHGVVSPNPPSVVTDAAGNRYLEVRANGGLSAGSRLIVFNEAQWTGDYLAAGVSSIEADVLNESDLEFIFRIAFEGPLGALIFASTFGAVVAPSTSWQHVSFSLLEGDLSPVGAPGDLAAALSDVSRLRILHNPVFSHLGAVVDASFGLDNVTTNVPEPAILWLAALAALALRRRAHSPS